MPETRRATEIGTSHGPIFVDSTGRRARVVRRVGYVVTGLCAAYTVVLGLSLAGVTSIAPSTLVPLPGVPSEPLTSRTVTEPDRPAARSDSRGRTNADPATSGAVRGDGSVPGSPAATPIPTQAEAGQGLAAVPGSTATATPTHGPRPAAVPAPDSAPSPADPTPADPAPQQPPAGDPAPPQSPAGEPVPQETPSQPAPQQTPVPGETPSEPAPQSTPVPQETPTDQPVPQVTPTDPTTSGSGTSDPVGEVLSDVLSPAAGLLPAAAQ